MKSLKEYINEGWEEFVDDNTGEIVKMWVDEKPIQKAIDAIKEDPKEYKKKLDKEKSLRGQLEQLEDKQWELKEELKGKVYELKDLRIDMEEEVGQLYAKGKDIDAETLAQNYGKQMDQLSKDIENLKKQINALQPKIDALDMEIFNLWN